MVREISEDCNLANRLFKLHSPDNFIVGGGFFVRYSALPASLAWGAFEQKNGVTSLNELRSRVRRYRTGDVTLDPIIGCNALAEPFFFEQRQWIPMPASFALNIVSGKSYDTTAEDGAMLWERVRQAIVDLPLVQEAAGQEQVSLPPRFAEPA